MLKQQLLAVELSTFWKEKWDGDKPFVLGFYFSRLVVIGIARTKLFMQPPLPPSAAQPVREEMYKFCTTVTPFGNLGKLSHLQPLSGPVDESKRGRGASEEPHVL